MMVYPCNSKHAFCVLSRGAGKVRHEILGRYLWQGTQGFTREICSQVTLDRGKTSCPSYGAVIRTVLYGSACICAYLLHQPVEQRLTPFPSAQSTILSTRGAGLGGTSICLLTVHGRRGCAIRLKRLAGEGRCLPRNEISAYALIGRSMQMRFDWHLPRPLLTPPRNLNIRQKSLGSLPCSMSPRWLARPR